MYILLTCVVLLVALATPTARQLGTVGQLSFPTSGSAEAQRHFLRGVALLHSFGYKQAIAEFQLAQKAQPDFAMAYWGEALCYSQVDPKEARGVMARLGANRGARVAKAPTDREKGFINAVEELLGEGDSRRRRIAYMNAMERLYTQFPDDNEVKTLFALSILNATSAFEDRTSRMNVKAGSLAMDVFKRNPGHPGAAHYIIHAFDDPVHAPLALEAARAYAKIVPAVSHAVHMPTHIFIQHGMWNEVATQNIRAFDVAKELWQPGDAPGDMLHSGDWGQYGFLQLGDYAGARERIQAFERIAETTKDPGATATLSLVRARYIVETEEWKVWPIAETASNDTILANGFSAVKTGDMETATKMLSMLAEKAGATPGGAAAANPHAAHGAAPTSGEAAASKPAPGAAVGGGSDASKAVRVMHKQLTALIAQASGQNDQAIALLKEAVQLEESMRPPIGAAYPIKPSHELLGEVLLQAGQSKEAAEAFEAGLLRMPNRARSLMGAIQAHGTAGNKEKAAERLATLNGFWKGKPISKPATDAR